MLLSDPIVLQAFQLLSLPNRSEIELYLTALPLERTTEQTSFLALAPLALTDKPPSLVLLLLLVVHLRLLVVLCVAHRVARRNRLTTLKHCPTAFYMEISTCHLLKYLLEDGFPSNAQSLAHNCDGFAKSPCATAPSNLLHLPSAPRPSLASLKALPRVLRLLSLLLQEIRVNWSLTLKTPSSPSKRMPSTMTFLLRLLMCHRLMMSTKLSKTLLLEPPISQSTNLRLQPPFLRLPLLLHQTLPLILQLPSLILLINNHLRPHHQYRLDPQSLPLSPSTRPLMRPTSWVILRKTTIRSGEKPWSSTLLR